MTPPSGQASGIQGTWANSGRAYDGWNGQFPLWEHYGDAR